MINSYFIRNVNGEEVLYLNFDFSYEFSSFDFMAKREKIQEVVRNFIRDNKISFKGMTVLLVSGGVLFGSIVLNTPNFTGSPVNSIKPIESSVTNDDFVVPNASVTLSNGDSVVINDEMMELGKYIKKKTLCTLISAYQTMLPSALKAHKDFVVNKKYETYLTLCCDIEVKSDKQKEVYELPDQSYN